jgi:hypothetical protein
VIPSDLDPETGFPPGYVAEVDGEAVRRVGCNGDPTRGIAGWTVVAGRWPWAELEADRLLVGDCYVDAAGKRVDPTRVVVRRRVAR